MTRPVTAQVPIILTGESPGAHNVNGTVMQQLRTADVQALPLEMPSQIEIDLEVMAEPDSVIRASDLPIPENATLLTDSEELVARIELPRVAEEAAIGGVEGLAEGAGAQATDTEETTEE